MQEREDRVKRRESPQKGGGKIDEQDLTHIMDNLNNSFNLPNLKMVDTYKLEKPMPSFEGAFREDIKDDFEMFEKTLKSSTDQNWEKFSEV